MPVPMSAEIENTNAYAPFSPCFRHLKWTNTVIFTLIISALLPPPLQKSTIATTKRQTSAQYQKESHPNNHLKQYNKKPYIKSGKQIDILWWNVWFTGHNALLHTLNQTASERQQHDSSKNKRKSLFGHKKRRARTRHQFSRLCSKYPNHASRRPDSISVFPAIISTSFPLLFSARSSPILIFSFVSSMRGTMLVIICGFGEIVQRCGEKMKKNNLRLSYAYAV